MEGTGAVTVITVHGLMHEVLEGERLRGAGESKGGGGAALAAVQYFEAFHLISEGGLYYVLRTAKENYGDELGNEKEIVMAAVAQNGRALYYASDKLKNDKEIVMAAVAQKGRALGYASDELKNDKEVVTAAVAQNGDALKYVSEELTVMH